MDRHRLLALAGAMALASCGVSGPVRTASNGTTNLPAELAIDAGAAREDTLLARFASRLQRELGQRGVATRSGAPYQVTLSLAESDAATGVTFDKGGEGRTVTWQSPPVPHHWYQRCHARRLRAVVSGPAAVDTAPLRAQAELDLCRVDDEDLDRLASALAREITRRAAPKG